MNEPLRISERQSSTVSSQDIPAPAFALIGGALGAVTLWVWLSFGWWVLAFGAAIAVAVIVAKLIERFELGRIEYQRPTPWEAGVGRDRHLGRSLDVRA